MIIEALINLVYSIFSLLTSGVKVPPLPDEVLDILGQFFDYISTGMSILNNFVHLPYLLVLFGIIVTLEVVLHIYYFVLWVLKKIPFLGME
jgi:hypothetical protein